jgi:hypothetical protein
VCDVVSDKVGVLFHFTVLVFLQFQDEADVVVLVTRGNMEVEMKDGLPCDTPIVREKVKPFELESLDKRRGDNSRRIHERRIALWLQREEIAKMFSWNDEGVAVMDRVDVEDRYHLIIFKEDFGRDCTADDSAKNAITHYSARCFSILIIKNLFKFPPKVKTVPAGSKNALHIERRFGIF